MGFSICSAAAVESPDLAPAARRPEARGIGNSSSGGAAGCCQATSTASLVQQWGYKAGSGGWSGIDRTTLRRRSYDFLA